METRNNSDSTPLLEIDSKKMADSFVAPRAPPSSSSGGGNGSGILSKNGSSDPFYTVKDSVSSQVDKIKVRYEQFLGLVKTVDTATHADFKELRKNLVKDVRKADRDVGGLKGTVDMVQKNRLKFPHIKDTELASRKKFVDEMQEMLDDVKNGIDSSAVRRKLEEDETKMRRAAFDGSSDALRTSVDRENHAFVADQRQMTQETIQHQDIQLDHLGQAVDRLGQMGKDINQELQEQNLMLDQLDNDLGDAGEKMNVVMEGLAKLLKTRDGCQIWTIVILAIILVLLVVAVIWL